MSKPERIRRCWFSVCWLAAILAIPVLLTGQEWRQLQREKALIDSIPHKGTPAALELLAQGVNPNTCQSAQSKPPGLLQALRLLLRLEKPPAQTGLPVLMLAAQQGNDTVMRALMAKGANVNVADEKGGAPLMWAIAKHDDPATVQKFLERGANVKASKPGGTTVLMCAIVKHDAILVRELLNRGGDASQPAHYGHEDWMPLAQAYEDQQGALVDLLLAHGADPDATIGGHVDPHSLLAVAVERGDWKYFRAFLVHHADANLVTKADSPLCAAAERGQIEMARILLAHGADVNQATLGGFTPFIHARTYKMKTFLLSRGAAIEATTYHSRTTLMWAAENGNSDEIHYLREHGANVHRRDIYGMNAVFLALKYPPVVRMLLEAGVTPNVATTFQDCGQWRSVGMTPLMEAAKEGYLQTAKLLLAYGAHIHTRDNTGRSALDYAHQANQLQVARLLLQAGALRKQRHRH